jgi:polyisoprenoid-binding protein YceI
VALKGGVLEKGRLALLLLALPLSACREKPKRVLRTEPWPAPAVAVSGARAAESEGPLRYTLEHAVVELELPAKRGKPRGKLSRVEGTIDLDSAHLERTRARLTADLQSLTLGAGGEEDAPLLAKAFDWLELGPDRSSGDRARDRYAILNITAVEPPPASADEGSARRRAARVVAHGDLTLHHFRVPVALELDVELRPADGGAADLLVIRTRRPFVVSLAAHDILPRDARGALLSTQLSTLGSEVGRDARITAELRARAAPAPESSNP